MATLAPRNPEMMALHESLALLCFGRSLKASIESDICVSCGGQATEFPDEVSTAEYTISGLCQACQDDAFDNSKDDGMFVNPDQRGQLTQ